MPKYSSGERRGSDREKNVTRPTLDAKAANAKAPTPSGEDASQKTGTAAMSGRASKARFHWSTLPRLCGTFFMRRRVGTGPANPVCSGEWFAGESRDCVGSGQCDLADGGECITAAVRQIKGN